MSHIAYVNGRYGPHREAVVSIDDRAMQFADAVYEVTCIWNGRPVSHAAHLARLERSLAALRIPMPMSPPALTVICREVIGRNRIDRGILYIQVSRGIAPRAHAFPARSPRPSVIVTARAGALPTEALAEQGVKVVTAEDIRWGRCDIKVTGLLPNVLAKQAAAEAKAFETLLHANGVVTEGSSNNAWMVATDGTIVTHPLTPEILGGVTRAAVLDLAKKAGYKVAERPFTLKEALSAREIFLTGTTTFVMPVVQVDETIIANGAPGSIARDLHQHYAAYVADQTASEAAWTA